MRSNSEGLGGVNCKFGMEIAAWRLPPAAMAPATNLTWWMILVFIWEDKNNDAESLELSGSEMVGWLTSRANPVGFGGTTFEVTATHWKCLEISFAEGRLLRFLCQHRSVNSHVPLLNPISSASSGFLGLLPSTTGTMTSTCRSPSASKGRSPVSTS